MTALVVVAGKADLLQVVLAGHPVGGLPDLLDSGQQQADQDGNNGDDDQQLNEREGALGVRLSGARSWTDSGVEGDGDEEGTEVMIPGRARGASAFRPVESRWRDLNPRSPASDAGGHSGLAHTSVSSSEFRADPLGTRNCGSPGGRI